MAMPSINGQDRSGTDDDDRNEKGQYSHDHDHDAQDVLDHMEPGEWLLTSELVDAFDIPRRTIYQWLQSFHESGEVEKEKVNSRTVKWRKPEGRG